MESQTQSKAGADPSQPKVLTEPQITIALIDPSEKLYVWSSLRLQISITNGSYSSGIAATGLKLSIPPSLGVEMPGNPPLSDGTVQILVEPSLFPTPGERRDLTPISFERKPLSLWDGQLIRALTYRSRKEVLVATLLYKRIDDQIDGVKTSRLLTSVEAHPLGMYAGTLLGYLLRAILLVLYRLPGVFVGGLMAGFNRGWRFLLRFGQGIVATAIVTLLFQTSSEVSLPISIAVHDFYGGILLGLLGDKAAGEIRKRFF